MPGSGGVGAMMAFAFAAFWLAVVLAEVVDAATTATEDAATEVGFLLTAVEAETTVLEHTTAAEVFAAEEEDFALEEVVEFAAAEAGLEGGLAVEGALAEEAALEDAFEGALEGAFAAEEGALEGTFDGAFAAEALFVTVFVEVPLMAVFVSTTNISLPLAAVSEPATCTSFRGTGAALTATQGVTKIGMASKTGIGGGGGGATG
jgi:hypothetical protein